MAELKCTNCGGIMQTDEANEFAVCEYCGAKQRIEKSEAELKAEILKKKEQEKIENKDKRKQKIKKLKKTILIIVAVWISLNIIFTLIALLVPMDDDLDYYEQTTIENTTESISNETSTQNYENSFQYVEPIEIAELFNGDLETAEELLEPQSKAPQDMEAYTKYTFNCVTVMCEYGTNNIYSISVDYTNKNTNVEYTVFGLSGNTTQTNWESALGEMFFQGYDSNDNPVYSYELEYDEDTTYNIEITATSETPDKITVYKYTL